MSAVTILLVRRISSGSHIGKEIVLLTSCESAMMSKHLLQLDLVLMQFNAIFADQPDDAKDNQTINSVFVALPKNNIIIATMIIKYISIC